MEGKTTVSVIYRDYDPVSRITTKVFRKDRDNLGIEYEQDVSSILENNRARAAMVDENERWGELAHVASIPVTLLSDLQRRGVIGKDLKVLRHEDLAKILNDRDYLKLRTRPGKI